MGVKKIFIFLSSFVFFSLNTIQKTEAGLKEKYDKRSQCNWESAQYNDVTQEKFEIRYCVTSDNTVIKYTDYYCTSNYCWNPGINSEVLKGKVGKSETYSIETPNVFGGYRTFTSNYITEFAIEDIKLIRYKCETEAFGSDCSSPLKKNLLGLMRFSVGKKKGIYKELIEQGDIYIGQIRKGIPFGYGQSTTKTGGKYIGYFKDGMRYGQGTYVNLTTGKKYVGEFKNNLKEGKGTQFYVDGSKQYEGEWRNGEYDGQGNYYWEEGITYKGEFKNNFRNGKGILYFANGESVNQVWEKGKLIREY